MPPVTPEIVRRTRASPGSPKKSAFKTAVGRAPIAKTSRRIPPTPVAAPWNGSIADGWLWLSTLKTQRSPSPRSTAPAFSPGPTATDGPREGSVRRSFLECLYAQCSLHIAPNIAHSSAFGSRPLRSRTRAASCSVRPASCGIWLGCAVFVVPKAGDALTFGGSLRAPSGGKSSGPGQRILLGVLAVARPTIRKERTQCHDKSALVVRPGKRG